MAVVVETMREPGMTEELAWLLTQEESDVGPDHIVTALVAQRCLDPPYFQTRAVHRQVHYDEGAHAQTELFDEPA